MARPVVFLSDFGLEDEFVGVCHGVMARVAPDVRVIDLTHGIPAQDVMRGALALASAAGYVPMDAVILAVVDPGVGGRRRPVAVEAASGALLVGPDNGLLSLAWERLGGAARAVVIESPDVILTPTSATFHGRDVFAPAAAHLANGMPIDRLGSRIDPASLARASMQAPEIESARIRCAVIGIDRFGNARLSATQDDLRAAGMGATAVISAIVAGGSALVLSRARTFADVPDGEPSLLVDSSGWLTISVNRGSAATAFGLRTGATVELRAAEPRAT